MSVGIAVKHILIVDDDALLRASVAFNLQKAGYIVTAVATAEEAVTGIPYWQPDVVLLDIGLPGMDGLEALQALQSKASSTPVIFVTARRRELDEVVGLELGADD